MFSGKIEVQVLRPHQIHRRMVDDINELLEKQHSKARGVDERSLLRSLKRTRVVVAWNCDERLVGIGILVKTPCLCHTFAGIHNFVIREGYDPLSIGVRIVQLLIENIQGVDFIIGGFWLQDDEMGKVFLALGFEKLDGSQYRLKCPIQPKVST